MSHISNDHCGQVEKFSFWFCFNEWWGGGQSLTAAVVLPRCSDILIGIVEILVEFFCGENDLDGCNRKISRLTPNLSAHTFVNAFTSL